MEHFILLKIIHNKLYFGAPITNFDIIKFIKSNPHLMNINANKKK